MQTDFSNRLATSSAPKLDFSGIRKMAGDWKEKRIQEKKKENETLANVSAMILQSNDPQKAHARFRELMPEKMREKVPEQFSQSHYEMVVAKAVPFDDLYNDILKTKQADQKQANALELDDHKTENKLKFEGVQSGNKMDYLNRSGELQAIDRSETDANKNAFLDKQQRYKDQFEDKSSTNDKSLERLRQKGKAATGGHTSGTRKSVNVKINEKQIVDSVAQIVPDAVDDEGNVTMTPELRKLSIAGLKLVKSGEAGSVLEAVEILHQKQEGKKAEAKAAEIKVKASGYSKDEIRAEAKKQFDMIHKATESGRLTKEEARKRIDAVMARVREVSE